MQQYDHRGRHAKDYRFRRMQHRRERGKYPRSIGVLAYLAMFVFTQTYLPLGARSTTHLLNGRSPYYEYVEHKDGGAIVKALYQRREFPSVQGLELAEVVMRCWHGTFENMDQVLEAIQPEQKPAEAGPLSAV